MKALAGWLAPRSYASTTLAMSASQQNSRDVPYFRSLFKACKFFIKLIFMKFLHVCYKIPMFMPLK
jgi:hypothetical protein